MIKCIRGIKVGDSLLRTEDGDLQPIFPDTFYPRKLNAYWMLKRIGEWWKVIKILRIPDVISNN